MYYESLKKFTSIALISGQLFSCLPSMASAAPEVSPEDTLIANILIFQDADISQPGIQSQILLVTQDYLKTSSPEGRTEKLTQAMLDVGLYTPAQVEDLVANTKATLAQASSDPTQTEINGMFQTLLSSHPAGAEFSQGSCGTANKTVAVGVFGFLGTSLTALILGNNDCTPAVDPHARNARVCGTPAAHTYSDKLWTMEGVVGGAFFVTMVVGVILKYKNCTN